MRKILIYGLLLLVLCISSCITKQNVEVLNIKVIGEQKDGLPLAIVKMYNSDTTFVIETDFGGNLDLQNVKSGLYKADVSYTGYKRIKNYRLKIRNRNKNIVIAMKLLPLLDTVKVNWSGGRALFQDKDGKFQCVRIK